MRQLRMPRLDPIESAPTTERSWQERPLPKCGHQHPHLEHVACTLDRGHRSELHAHPTKQAIYRW